MARRRRKSNTGKPTKSSYAVVRGSKARPIPAARGMSKRDATRAAASRRKRPGMKGKGAAWRVRKDSTLDSKPRGRGGLAGRGDAGTRAAKREERSARARNRK
jgi:hypothetical protein